jgi:hypothetical protein
MSNVILSSIGCSLLLLSTVVACSTVPQTESEKLSCLGVKPFLKFETKEHKGSVCVGSAINTLIIVRKSTGLKSQGKLGEKLTDPVDLIDSREHNSQQVELRTRGGSLAALYINDELEPITFQEQDKTQIKVKEKQ